MEDINGNFSKSLLNLGNFKNYNNLIFIIIWK